MQSAQKLPFLKKLLLNNSYINVNVYMKNILK